MSEEFREENTKGEIIKFDKDTGEDGEHEGVRWRVPNIAKIFRSDNNSIKRQTTNTSNGGQRIVQQQTNQLQAQLEQERRLQAEQERRLQAELLKVRNMEIQIQQLSARISQLENTIRDKDSLIERKDKHIAFLTSENTRLRKKVNALIDNLQYYKTSVLGTDQIDGYKTTIVKQQLKIDELLQQEVGKPITESKDGFKNLYEGLYGDFANISGRKELQGYNETSGLTPFELISEEVNNIGKEQSILEGYVDQAMSSYNTVFVENQAIQNHIDNTTNVYSINNQLASNIIAKQNTLNYVNYILIFVFLIVYLYGCYKIYTIDGMENNTKIAICVAMLFTFYILHIIEYILFTILPIFIAFLLKTPLKPSGYIKLPNIYDYLPKLNLPPRSRPK